MQQQECINPTGMNNAMSDIIYYAHMIYVFDTEKKYLRDVVSIELSNIIFFFSTIFHSNLPPPFSKEMCDT